MKGRFVFASFMSAGVALSILSTNRMGFILCSCLWFVRCLFLQEFRAIRGICIVSLISFICVYFLHFQKNTQLLPTETRFLIQADASQLKVDGDRVQFYGKVISNNISENIVVFYTVSSALEKEKWSSIDTSTTLQIEGNLKVPEKAGTTRLFDYSSFLRRKNIYWVLEAETISEGPSQRTTLQKIKESILIHITKTIPGRTGIYLKALFFGDKREFGYENLDSFRKLGLVHLLSISGMHVYFLSAVFQYFLLRLGVTRERTTYLVLVFLFFYGGLLGWATSIFRAVFQKTTSMCSQKLNLGWTSLDCWSCAFVLSILIQPFYLFDAGYQLSYSLSFLLLFLSQSEWFVKKSKGVLFILSPLLIFCVSIPILSYHFFEIQWMGLFLNVISIPFFTFFLMPLFLIVFIASLFIPEFFLFHAGIEKINQLLHSMEKGISLLSFNKISSFITGRLSIKSYLLLIFLIIIAIVLFETSKYLHFVPVLFLFISVLYSKRFSPLGTITMIDVGQAESILIKEPNGKGSYMIDAGSHFTFPKEDWQLKEKPYSVGETVLIPFLKSQGVHKLDAVFLTHSDIDHTGSVKEISETMKIKKAMAPSGTWVHPEMEKTVAALKQNKVPVFSLSSGQKIHLSSKNRLLVLAPEKNGDGKNDDSLVLYGSFGEKTWLFTGDIEKESENKLISTYPKLQADILKVAHHGSRTSTQSAFVSHVKPQIALISHGKNNVYGHPHQEVVDTLMLNDVSVFRTGEHGSITYTYKDDKSFFTLEKERSESEEE